FDTSFVLDAYDAFLRNGAPAEPAVLLRFGALPTSRPLQQFIQSCADARLIVVDPAGWRDPSNGATDMLHADPVLLCDALAHASTERASGDWAATWISFNDAARRALEHHLH